MLVVNGSLKTLHMQSAFNMDVRTMGGQGELSLYLHFLGRCENKLENKSFRLVDF